MPALDLVAEQHESRAHVFYAAARASASLRKPAISFSMGFLADSGAVWSEPALRAGGVVQSGPLRSAASNTRQIAWPPDTSMRCALIQRLSSDSSEAIIGPMSSGSPGRPSAVTSAM